MPQFRKKPVVIDAVQVTNVDWNGSDFDGCPFSELPDWIRQADEARTIEPTSIHDTDYASWRIFTLEGTMIANPGDWIIRGIKGELYPCKPDIFEATYERVQDDTEKTSSTLLPPSTSNPEGK